MPARRDPLTGRFLPAQAAEPVVNGAADATSPSSSWLDGCYAQGGYITAGPAPRKRIRPSHYAAVLALLILLAAAALVVFT